jgi:hypothetical protein
METALVKPQENTEVMAFYNEALSLQEYAEARVIVTAEDLKPATDDLTIIANVKKGMEGKRKEYVVPLQGQVIEINDAFKTLMAPIEQADRTTRRKILEFQTEQERIRKEQEEINHLKMEVAEKEMKLNGELSESVGLVEVVPEVPTTVRTDMGMQGQRANWKYEVFDFDLLPREYKMVDGAQLSAIAKRHHDQKQILGVRFYNEPIIAVRPKQ